MDLAAWTILLRGAWITIWISGISIILGVTAGFGVAALRNARIPVVGQVLTTYISVARATPMPTLVLFLFVSAPLLPFDVERLSLIHI